MNIAKYRIYQIKDQRVLGRAPENSIDSLKHLNSLSEFKKQLKEKTENAFNIEILQSIGVSEEALLDLIDNVASILKKIDRLNDVDLNTTKVFFGDGMKLNQAIEAAIKI